MQRLPHHNKEIVKVLLINMILVLISAYQLPPGSRELAIRAARRDIIY